MHVHPNFPDVFHSTLVFIFLRTHEDNVANGLDLACMEELLENLARPKVIEEAHGACGAKGAAHGTAHLARDAESGTLAGAEAIFAADIFRERREMYTAIAHDNRFDEMPILQADEQLGGRAV